MTLSYLWLCQKHHVVLDLDETIHYDEEGVDNNSDVPNDETEKGQGQANAPMTNNDGKNDNENNDHDEIYAEASRYINISKTED